MARPIRKERSELFHEGIQDIRSKAIYLSSNLSKLTDQQLERWAKLDSREAMEELFREVPVFKKLAEYHMAVSRMFFGHIPDDGNALPIDWEDTALGGIPYWSSWEELKKLIEADSLGVLAGPGFEQVLNQRIEELKARNTGGEIQLKIYRDKLIQCRTEGVEAAFADNLKRDKDLEEYTETKSDTSSIFKDVTCPNCGEELLIFGGIVCPYCGYVE